MKRMPRPVLALACALFCACVCAAQPIQNCPLGTPAAGRPPINLSKLCVRLVLRDGRLYFNRADSLFTRSAQFTGRLGISEAEAKDAVYAELDRVMNLLTPLYRLALTDEEKKLSVAEQEKLAPPAVRGDLDGALGAAKNMDAFNTWAASVDGRSDYVTVISVDATSPPNGLVVPLLKADELNGLLIYDDGSYDPDSAIVTFSVADPISDVADPTQLDIQLPGLAGDPTALTSRRAKLQRALGKQNGRPRCGICIKKRIESYYRDLGLNALVQVLGTGASPLVVSVIEAPRIVAVSWQSLTAKDEADVDKVLYSLLTDEAFRVSLRDTARCTRQGIRTNKVFNYQNCTGRPGPYLSLPALQVQQQLVNQLGYTVSVVQSAAGAESAEYVMVFQRTEGEVAEANDKPEAAPALPDEERHVDPHEQEEAGATEPEPQTEPQQKGQKLEDKKNFIGGGVEYRPGQGARFFGLGQRQRLPLLPDGVTSVSASGGGQADDGALGGVNFFTDYLFFNSLHRRLSVQLTVENDLDADRALTATPVAPVDERRRGGVGRVELEPFRDKGGQLLRFYAEGRRDTVELKPAAAPLAAVRQNLTTLDLGALYVFESRQVENPRRARFEPRLRFGLGLAEGESRFNKFSATGAYHQKLPRRFELDFSGRVEAASRRTPLFELPTFGGSESVRGFRRDDAVGRKLWSLQSELWVPLPVGGEEGAEGLKALLRQSVKLAPFVDVGGLYDAARGTGGGRAGAGLGLRLIYNPIVFRLDYGYGFGEAATGGRRGKFHFGVVSNLPF